MTRSILDRFRPQVATWFEEVFAAPTPVQEAAWTAISGGDHALVVAPTGSGKTLAAFLWAIDRLLHRPVAGEQTDAPEKAAEKTYGFAKQYPRIIEEYFGGMARHLLSLRSVLRSGGKCAYVVGDQRTYLQTYTPTGQILGILSERMGYRVADSITWRIRKGTTGSGEEIREEILVLEKA